MEQRLKKLSNIIKTIETIKAFHPTRKTQIIKANISSNFNYLKIQVQDMECNHDAYEMTLEFDEGDGGGTLLKFFEHNLPSDVCFNPRNTILGYLSEMTKQIERYSYYQSGLAFLDEYCCVVEPVQPKLKDNYRVIKYDKKIYMKILIPAEILEIQDIKVTFFGPNRLTEPLMEVYAKKAHKVWDYSAGFLLNLKKVFGINCFLDHSAMSAEKPCGICFAYRDAGGLAPIYTCDNLECDGQFHLNCIRKWWESKKFMKIFHGVTKGECASCKNVFEVLF